MIERRKLFLLGLAASLLLAACAMEGGASKVNLAANLSGTAEVPPVAGTGTGRATVTLDRGSRTLTWNVTYSGLSGPVTGAHFHGPAAAGANAGVAVPMTQGPSPMQGSAVLNETQVADLLAGRWYVNLHTAANRGGEIRGQVLPTN